MSDINIFVDRGDPASNDFTQADLTMDDTWRDLDLSSIVPAGATAVLLTIYLDGTATKVIRFREKGNSNDYNIQVARMVSTSANSQLLVSCDSNRVIQYKSTSFTSVQMTVAGWIIPLSASGVVDLSADASPSLDDLIYTIDAPGGTPADKKVTLQNALKLAPHWVWRTDVTAWDYSKADLTIDSSWHDLDLSAIVPAGATAVLIKTSFEHSGAEVGFSFRMNGASDAYAQVSNITVVGNIIHRPPPIIVPCDSSRVIEYLVGNTATWASLDIAILGWYIDTVN